MKKMIRIYVLMISSLFAVNLSFGQQLKIDETVTDTLQYLTDLIEDKKTDEGLLIEAYLHRGEWYYNHFEYEAALKDCNKGLELDASQRGFYVLRGGVYFALNEAELALKDFNRAIALERTDLAVLNRAIAYYHLKAFELSRNDFEDYLEAVKDDAVAWSYYASILIKYREFQKAVDAYLTAVGLDPTDVENYFHLGYAYEEAGDLEKAEKAYLAGLRVDDKNARLRGDLCYFYLDNDNQEKAKIHCNFDDLSDSTIAHIYAMNAFKYATQNSDYRKAIDALTVSIMLDSSDLYFIDRGLYYAQYNMYDSAIVDYEIALMINPDDYIMNNNLGILYFELNRFEEAIEPLNKSIKLAPYFPYSYNNRALCYLNLGKLKEAKRDAHKSKVLDASNSYVYFSFAGIAALEGDDDKFYKELQYAVNNGFPLHRYENSSFLDKYKEDKQYQKLLQKSKVDNN